MQRYSLSHLVDAVLLRDGAASARNESASTAVLLAHIAEIDRRRLFADEGYDSMSAFCVGEWGLCEYAAYRRIDAARAARQFPALFDAVAGGRLTLTTVNLLAPALTNENASELIAAAARMTKRQVQELLAERAAKAEPPARSAVAAPEAPRGALAPALVVPIGASEADSREEQPAGPLPAVVLAPLHYPLHALLGKTEQDDLEYLKALLGHVVPSGEITRVLGKVFQAAIRELERKKFAVTARSRAARGGQCANPHHVPAPVRRQVFVRDGGCCTFVSAKGRRCGSRKRLEFDHLIPVAKGGQSTEENLRLLCRTHNQRAAEKAFGAGFMESRRAEARGRAEKRGAAARAKEAERSRREAHARELEANAEARARALEVMPWLRALGVRADEARRAALRSECIPDAPLEERVRHALKGLAPAGTRRVSPIASGSPP